MNVTTSANWSRPAVGITRVEQNLARELARLYGTDQFDRCIFEDGEFIPYRGAAKPSRHTEAAPLIWPDASRRMPRSSTFDPVLKRAQWRPLERAPEAVAAEAKPTSDKPFSSDGRSLKYGDIIVSVGLDWEYPYLDHFQHLKDTLGIKIVSCCYDLIPILYPQFCVDYVSNKFKDYFTKLSWSSSLILCISESSRNDYIDFAKKIGMPEVDTLVIPLGDNVSDQARAASGDVARDEEDGLSPEVRRAAERPFILFVSTIERRKNHQVLHRAYHILAAAGHADRLPRLVFVGMPGWGVESLLKDIELDPLTKGLVVQLHHVSDRELNHLYEKAYLCAYPSLYEGWGLPIGEALAFGKAVIASAESSIPEVGGDLVTYLDPWNPRAWADEILALVDNPDRVKAREAQVRAQYRTRTWRGTAEVVKTALDRLREQTDVSTTLYPGYDLLTLTGTPCGEAIRSTGAGGPLTHGPYRSLPAGTYDIEIAMDKLAGDPGHATLSLRSNQGGTDHGTLRVDFDEQEHFGVVARMERIRLDDQIDDYEIYSEISNNLLISLNRININRHS